MPQLESTSREFHRRIHITVSEKINIAQLTQLLNQIPKTIPGLAGCTACGLTGIDILIGPGGDPGPIVGFREMPGVTGVIVSER